jgi:hypothetical protein
MVPHPIPRHQVDSIQLQVAERMDSVEPLRTVGNFLHTKLNEHGVMEVSGPTQSRLIKKMVLQALRDIPGIQDIEDHIVTDPDLELAIAWGLAHDDRTKDLPPGKIFIRSQMGVITIFGNLPQGFLQHEIVDVVANVNGVRDVEVKVRF